MMLRYIFSCCFRKNKLFEYNTFNLTPIQVDFNQCISQACCDANEHIDTNKCTFNECKNTNEYTFNKCINTNNLISECHDITIIDDKIIKDIKLNDCMIIKVINCPNITKIPDMNNYQWLETLLISHCSIDICRTYFPDSLRTLEISYCGMRSFIPQHIPIVLAELDLSFNKLTQIPTCVSLLHDNKVKINLKNNDLWFTMYSDLSTSIIGIGVALELYMAHKLNLVSTTKIMTTIRILEYKELYNEAILLKNLTKMNMEIRRKEIFNTTQNAQNVHLTSIQDSMTNSIKFIMSHEEMPLEIAINNLLNGNDIDFMKDIRDRCDITMLHSIYKANYKQILLRVCTIIDKSSHKTTLWGILRNEILDGMDTCLTGQITRMVNSLNGFIDGIHITINKTEELSNSVVALRKRYAIIYHNQDEYISETIPAVWQLLEDMCIPEVEHNVWLEYV